VCFSVSVYRDGNDIPPGGAYWLPWDRYLAAKYFEVFLNGPAPDCHAARSQWFVIEELSDKPQIDVTTGAPHVA